MSDRSLVIVPTYNERDSIAEVMERLFAAVPAEVELLVVDDSSPDGTADLVAEAQGSNDRIHLLVRESKDGLGRAYLAGFRWALEKGFDAVVEMDADLSHDPSDVPRLLAALDDADLVVGSRYIEGGRVENWGNVRKMLSRYGNIYARALLRFDVSDSTSGFRAYRTSALRDLDLDGVASHGYAFQIEMTRRVHLAGGEISEVPITFIERVKGTSKMSKRIVTEALWEVTAWGIGDRLRRKRPAR